LEYGIVAWATRSNPAVLRLFHVCSLGHSLTQKLPPEVLERLWAHRGIPDRVSDAGVAEIVL
jgi:hypothetical protein